MPWKLAATNPIIIARIKTNISIVSVNIFHLPSLYSFETLDKKQLKARPYIDVWPHQVTFESGFDNTFMLVLQLACVLNMKGDWKSNTKIRIFVVVESKLLSCPLYSRLLCVFILPCCLQMSRLTFRNITIE